MIINLHLLVPKKNGLNMPRGAEMWGNVQKWAGVTMSTCAEPFPEERQEFSVSETALRLNCV